MGKKINANKQILQLGKNNNNYIWEAKYVEKQNYESHNYVFQHLEIKNFFQKFLKNYGLTFFKYKINFLESSIKILILYFKTIKTKNIISQINLNNSIKLLKKKNPTKLLWKYFAYRKKKKLSFKNNLQLKKKFLAKLYTFCKIYEYQNLFLEKRVNKKFQFKIKLKILSIQQKFLHKLNYFLYQKSKFEIFKKLKLNSIFKNNLKKIYKKYLLYNILYSFIKKIKLIKFISLQSQTYLKNFLINYHYHQNLLFNFLLNNKFYKKRLKTLRYYKKFNQLKTNKINKNIKFQNFLEHLNKSLNFFIKNKPIKSIILQQINQNIIFSLTYRQLQALKKIIIQLRQFKNSNFFKEGLNVILSVLLNFNSISLLANFIATQLKIITRHNFFFQFLLKALSLLIKYKFSRIKSIRIFIKGRINNKLRSKNKLIVVNKYISLMTIKSFIDFSQSTAYSLNGTIGVKVWTTQT